MLNRMRRVFFPALLSLLCVVAVPATAMAADKSDDSGYGTQVMDKFTRGVANTATGWVEIPKNMINVGQEQNIGMGLTWGLLKGTLQAVGRTVVGAFDLVTFFVPTNEFVHPKYVWKPFEKDTEYGAQ